MDSGQLFILLAQPCDLMVRTIDGSRKETANEGFIAELVAHRPKGPPGEPGYYELPYFLEDGSTWFINFRKWRSVKLWVLDLCVFDSDGRANFGLDSPCPPLLIPSWQKYHERIRDHVLPLVEALGQKGCRAISVHPTVRDSRGSYLSESRSSLVNTLRMKEPLDSTAGGLAGCTWLVRPQLFQGSSSISPGRLSSTTSKNGMLQIKKCF